MAAVEQVVEVVAVLADDDSYHGRFVCTHLKRTAKKNEGI